MKRRSKNYTKNNPLKNDPADHHPLKLPSIFELALISTQLWGKPIRIDNGTSLINGDIGYDEDMILGYEQCISTAYGMWMHADQFLSEKKDTLIQSAPTTEKYEKAKAREKAILEAYKTLKVDLVEELDDIDLNKLSKLLIPGVNKPEFILINLLKIDTNSIGSDGRYIGSEAKIAIACLDAKIEIINKQRHIYFSNLRNGQKNKIKKPPIFKLTDYKKVISQDWEPLLRFNDEQISLNDNF